MLANSCAFTGHRPHKFPWRYDETDSRCTALKTALAEQITSLVEAGVTAYYSGGADGVDCWAALIVLELKKKNPALNLHLILPYEGQADKWSASAQERYRFILSQADSLEYVSHDYYDGCMQFGMNPSDSRTVQTQLCYPKKMKIGLRHQKTYSRQSFWRMFWSKMNNIKGY